jgi:hypothetical protein
MAIKQVMDELFWYGNILPDTVDLDQWIRRRVRMCYWKQWRRPRTRVRNLIELGVPADLAVSCGASSRGYWHSARTEGIQLALNNKRLMEQGWVSSQRYLDFTSLRLTKGPVRTRKPGVVRTAG